MSLDSTEEDKDIEEIVKRHIEREKEELKREIKEEAKQEAKQELRNEIRNKDLTDAGKVEEKTQISRRNFLKKIGAGAAGIGALSLTPAASQLKITKNGISSDTGLDFLDSGTEYFKVNDGGPIEIKNTDIRLDTGQSIEDGNGTDRLRINSNRTALYSSEGNPFVVSREDNNRFDFARVRNNLDGVIRDAEGGFNALTYSASSSPPGFLELTNSVISRPLDGNTNIWRALNSNERGAQTHVKRVQNADGKNIYNFPGEIGNSGMAIVFVAGQNQNNSSDMFIDIVLVAAVSGATIVSSYENDTPASRSYSGGNNVSISISGTYDVTAQGISLAI